MIIITPSVCPFLMMKEIYLKNEHTEGTFLASIIPNL